MRGVGLLAALFVITIIGCGSQTFASVVRFIPGGAYRELMHRAHVVNELELSEMFLAENIEIFDATPCVGFAWGRGDADHCSRASDGQIESPGLNEAAIAAGGARSRGLE
jgi:hypothetical protein